MGHAEEIYFKLKEKKILITGIILLACIARLYRLGDIPAGVSADEAYAAYNAYSMLNYGVDSWGYHNPVYFIAWGSGMNVLNSYLMMPFIRIFGLTIWSIRLPQAILSCLSVYIFYKLLKLVNSEDFALAASFLLAICPWQIVMGRNNIESSLLCMFLIFSTYAFVKATSNPKYLYLAALLYGLTLYTYAVIWAVLPFIILLEVWYAVAFGKLRLRSRQLVLSGILLVVLAMPLLLFMLVNNGFIDEIATSWISVPRMTYMRNNDISLKFLPENATYFLNILSHMNKDEDVNSFYQYGLMYRFSNVFVLIGFCVLMSGVLQHWKQKEYTGETYLVIWLLCTGFLGMLLRKVNVIRINGLYPMLIVCIAMGISVLAKRYVKFFRVAAVVFYICCFVRFYTDYTIEYNNYVNQKPELKQCVEYVEQLHANKVCLDESISFAQVLFYTKMPVREFTDTVQYDDIRAAYMDAVQFGRYQRCSEYPMVQDAVGILAKTKVDSLDTAAYDLQEYGNYCVVVPKACRKAGGTDE